MKKIRLLPVAVLAVGVWWYFKVPESTVISVRIGQTFEEVVNASSFPVATSSDLPEHDEVGFGATWVKEPSVIIHFNDPVHGFVLPPTTFAAVGYMHNKVDTIATSPMLAKAPFQTAVEELANLQNQFQKGGWQLSNETEWFDLTPRGRVQLHEQLQLGSNGFMQTVLLEVPSKYSLTFRIWCAAKCDSRLGLDRYLIDIGISHNFLFEIEKMQRESELTP